MTQTKQPPEFPGRFNSLGGNVLLKWLGESRNSHRLLTAVAVSAPFDLAGASNAVEHGVSRIYKWALLGNMRRATTRKFKHVRPPFPLGNVRQLRSFRNFDDAVTAPLHGFGDAQDYYAKCSSRGYLRNITVPTLILHSSDDPLMSAAAVPQERELSPAVTLELSRKGGHVGFVSGSLLRPNIWLTRRIGEYLVASLAQPQMPLEFP